MHVTMDRLQRTKVLIVLLSARLVNFVGELIVARATQ